VMLSAFVAKVIVLFGLATALRPVTALEPKALALTTAAVVLVWTAAETRAFQRAKVPTIIPAKEPDGGVK
jgi:hypothetical protein